MTQNRLYSDSLLAQAMHNEFHNTVGLIMAQLVGLNYARKRKGPKTGKIWPFEKQVIAKGWIWTGKRRQQKDETDHPLHPAFALHLANTCVSPLAK